MQRVALEAKDSRAPPTHQATEDLTWWVENLQAWNGKEMLNRPVDEILEVDACESGLGAIRKHPGYKSEEAFKLLEPEDGRHNNVKELLAAEFGLQHFTKWHWQDKSILIKTDNTTSMAYVNRMGGKVPELCRITERLHSFRV